MTNPTEETPVVWRDERLYGVTRTHVTRPKDWGMKIPLSVLRCVVFLGHRGAPGPQSTGFLVSVDEEGARTVYLVTAAHCVEDQVGLFAFVNLPEGGVGEMELADGASWEYHPIKGLKTSENVDVALLPLSPEQHTRLAHGGYEWAPVDLFFVEDLFQDVALSPGHGFSLGEDVIAVGLYTVHFGTDKTQPIVRSGTLAMVPWEPVLVKVKNRPDVYETLYMVEMRSVGGHSGSPVFAQLRYTPFDSDVRLALLGVLIGGWDQPRGQSEHLDMGIGMVTPIKFVKQILDKEKLVTARKARAGQEVPTARRDSRSEETAPVDLDARVSLAPNDAEDVLRALLDTPPDPRS